jgi:hypothetical protein
MTIDEAVRFFAGFWQVPDFGLYSARIAFAAETTEFGICAYMILYN